MNSNEYDDDQGPDLYAFIGFIGFIDPDDNAFIYFMVKVIRIKSILSIKVTILRI